MLEDLAGGFRKRYSIGYSELRPVCTIDCGYEDHLSDKMQRCVMTQKVADLADSIAGQRCPPL